MQTEYRIDYQPFDFSTGADNIHVQRLDGDKWVTVWSTNEMRMITPTLQPSTVFVRCVS